MCNVKYKSEQELDAELRAIVNQIILVVVGRYYETLHQLPEGKDAIIKSKYSFIELNVIVKKNLRYYTCNN